MARRTTTGLGRIAPFACIAVLASLMLAGGLQARTPAGADAYRARVRHAIEAIPYKIGPAVGSDVEPTRAAQLLLTPNKIFQRRYTDPSTGWAQSLMIVHCNDARDMRGHYPPNCYPAHGWNAESAETVGITLETQQADAMRYTFTRRDDLIDRRMTVLDFFVIPEGGGSVFADMKKMGRTARSSDVGGLGVAQVQIVFDEDSSPEWRERMVRESLAAIAPAIRVIGEGVRK